MFGFTPKAKPAHLEATVKQARLDNKSAFDDFMDAVSGLLQPLQEPIQHLDDPRTFARPVNLADARAQRSRR